MRACRVDLSRVSASTPRRLYLPPVHQAITKGFISTLGYDTTDTLCQKTPIFLSYYALGACVNVGPPSAVYYIYSADSSGTLWLSAFSDAACSVSTGADTKLSAQLCDKGYSDYVYFTQAPDANINTLAAGSVIVQQVTYNAADTKCTGTPVSAYYVTAQSCIVSGSSSVQYIADGSGNVYIRTFYGTTTCASGKGSVTVSKRTSTNCVDSGVATVGPKSSYPIIGTPASVPIGTSMEV